MSIRDIGPLQRRRRGAEPPDRRHVRHRRRVRLRVDREDLGRRSPRPTVRSRRPRARQVPQPRCDRRLRRRVARTGAVDGPRQPRAARRRPRTPAIGPIVYEIVDPLGTVRVRLEPNDVQPISFDLVLRGVTPPFFEERNLVRNAQTNRIDVNVIRYHQGGWATGTDHRRRRALRARPARTASGSATTRGGSARASATNPTDLPSPPATARSHGRDAAG